MTSFIAIVLFWLGLLISIGFVIGGALFTLHRGDAEMGVADSQGRGGCADCGGSIGNDHGPSDGWTLEDGRTVCHSCCVADTIRVCKLAV